MPKFARPAERSAACDRISIASTHSCQESPFSNGLLKLYRNRLCSANILATMSLTNCRFYEEKYPEIDSFVMVNVGASAPLVLATLANIEKGQASMFALLRQTYK